MMHWFVWKDKNSISDFGLWISKLPKRTRAQERTQEVQIPGRSGSVILTEGEDVYDSYVMECTVIARNTINIQKVLEWLRGSGEVYFSNEIDKAFDARIAAKVEFERVGNSLVQARIPFLVQPLAHRLLRDSDRVTITGASGSLFNPGDVASKPKVSITGSGSNTITIAGNAMTFDLGSSSITIVVDCDAEIVTSGNDIWTGSYTGEFWRIPKGSVSVSQTGSATIAIDPEWRWV